MIPLRRPLYRLDVAREHLERARRALELNDHPACVGSSQLCAENAAKAVIAIYKYRAGATIRQRSFERW